MAENPKPPQPGKIENVRTYAEGQLRSGADRATVVQALVGMGLSAQAANDVVTKESARLETRRRPFPPGPAFVGGGFAGLLAGGAWGITGLWTGTEYHIMALFVGLLAGLGVAVMSNGSRSWAMPIVGISSALFAILVEKLILLLAFQDVGDLFGPTQIFWAIGGLVMGALGALPLGLRIAAVRPLLESETKFRRPTVAATMLMIAVPVLLAVSLFGTWSEWKASDTQGVTTTTTDFSWKMSDVDVTVTDEVLGSAESNTTTYDYDARVAGVDGKPFRDAFAKTRLFVLVGAAASVVALIMFVFPLFGARWTYAYQVASLLLAVLGGGMALVATAEFTASFPNAAGASGAYHATDSTGANSTNLTQRFWGTETEPGGPGTLEWGAGAGWYFAFASVVASLASAILPWSSRAMFRKEAWAAGRPKILAGPIVTRGPLPAEAQELPPPPPPAPYVAPGQTRLRCPDCRTVFGITIDTKPFIVSCPSCSRSTTIA